MIMRTAGYSRLTITGYPYRMIDDDFEWDDAKAARNKRDHGISFEKAQQCSMTPMPTGGSMNPMAPRRNA